MAQHRSVYLGGALGLCLLGFIYRNRIGFLLKMVMFSVVMLAVVALVILNVPKLEQRLTKAFLGVINPHADETASWRMKGWDQQLTRVIKTNLLFGEGLGSYYNRQDKGETNKWANPHNAYIQMTMKFGLFGLLAYGLLVYEFFSITLAARKRLSPGPLRAYVEVSIVNFGAVHAYMMAYPIPPIALIFYALGMAAVRCSVSVLHSPISSLRRGSAMAGRGRATAYDAG
jgi:O-antigen ligase